MLIVKKLVFAFPFLICSFFLFQSLPNVLQNLNFIFGLNLNALYQVLTLSALLLITSAFFIIFATLASDWKFVLPVIVITSSLPILFFEMPVNTILGIGTFFVLALSYLSLTQKLKSYLTFDPGVLLTPSIRQLITLLLLVISLTFYIISSTEIKSHGFKVPDSLIDTSLQMASSQLPQTETQNIPQIPPEQLQMLKENPALLKQYGLDPSILDQLDTTPGKKVDQTSLMKSAVSGQIQSIISPYTQFIAPILAILFFFTLSGTTSLLAIALSPLVWAIFKILEQTGLVRFEVEMREVKKLVV